MDTITNPISSNSVVQVDIPKPRCFKECGNSLNDWLKWLAYDKCITDWSTIDVQCLKDFLGNDDCEDIDLEKIITLLIEATCQLVDTSSLNCCNSTTVNLTLENSWTSDNLVRVTKKNGSVWLDGLVSGGSSTITTLPTGYRPSRQRLIPIVCEGISEVGWLTISTDGEIIVSAPSEITGDVSLDCVFLI